MKTSNIILLVIAVLFIVGIVWLGSRTPKNTESAPQTAEIKKTNNTTMTTVVMTTNKGAITLELFDTLAPKTVENFKKLAGEGFYDGVRFHRVIKSFMIQGGDPNSKDKNNMAMWGKGDPGYKFDDEIDPRAELYQKTGYQRGVLAMANSGPNTNGSQFFIMHQNGGLPPLYTIFGRVVSGLEVVDAIADVKTTGAPLDRPLEDMVIEKVEIVK